MGCSGSQTQPTDEEDWSPKARRTRSVEAEVKALIQKDQIVMNKYRMSMDPEAELGQGSFCICRKGIDIESGESVAIKVYKECTDGTESVQNKQEVMLKFRRQVDVLNLLQEPFVQTADSNLWHDALTTAKPDGLFMVLKDWTKDENEPGCFVRSCTQYTDDGVLYLITELAQYSLKDYFNLRREQCSPIPRDTAKSLARAILLVAAGLHAKGFVHLDFKPENLMMFNGRLKLIDVDGCVKAGSNLALGDATISFSLCYVAPEWATFLLDEPNSTHNVQPSLDAWSIGMTLCELITLDAMLKPKYLKFMQKSSSHQEANFYFLEFLSELQTVHLPKNVEKYDPEFLELIQECLLVTDAGKRKSCAQCLNHPYIVNVAKQVSEESDDSMRMLSAYTDQAMFSHLVRPDDDSKTAPLYKGTMWKLNPGADPKQPKSWMKRDMWLSQGGSLCYFSVREKKRLILIDGAQIKSAKITPFENCVLASGAAPAFTICFAVEEDGTEESLALAVSSDDEYKAWTDHLKGVWNVGCIQIPTIQLGTPVELGKFVVSALNRRQKVGDDEIEPYSPVFKEKLWKLRAEGDRLKPEDWSEREMWVAKNGSLVYYSQTDECNLVYYDACDLWNASYTDVIQGDSIKPHTFQLHLPVVDGVAFAPGEFAANSPEQKAKWLNEFIKVITLDDEESI